MQRVTTGLNAIIIILAGVLLAHPIARAAEPAAAPASNTAVQPAPAPAAPAEAAVAASETPAGAVTLGGRGGDDYAEGQLDVLLPLFLDGTGGLWFINPRGSANDNQEEEFNMGLGYRHLFEDQRVILGGNLFYDSRWTQDNNQFNQLGVGAEMLSNLFDARANYYLPEDTKELVYTADETVLVSQKTRTTYRQYAQEHEIIEKQRTTTTRTYRNDHVDVYDVPLEGYDMELGIKLPFPCESFEARVFGGYYHFEPVWEGNVATTDDIEGAKGRLELRVLPGLFLDAEVYENDELFGSDWLAGARAFLPFEISAIAEGKNPFAGARDGVRRKSFTFKDRLVENVIRDPHIQIRQQMNQTTTFSEDTIASISFQTLLDDVIFVNIDNANDPLENGTNEHPFDRMAEGIDATASPLYDTMYVYAGSEVYRENLFVGHDVTMIGEGMPLGTDGGFGGGQAPQVRGVTMPNGPMPPFVGPTLFVDGNAGARNVSIMGFDFMGHFPICADKPSSLMVVHADNVKNFEFAHNTVHDGIIGLAATYDQMAGFTADIHDNTFTRAGLGVGAMVDDASGVLYIDDNTLTLTTAGIGVLGMGGADFEAYISGNTIGGGGLKSAVCLLTDYMDIPPGLPSVAGIGLLAVDEARIYSDVVDNTIRDNLLGIAAFSYGPNAIMDIGIYDNVVRGGGLSPVLQTVADLTGWLDPNNPHLAFDSALAGIGVGAINGGTAYFDVGGNSVSRQLLGVTSLAIGPGSEVYGDIYENTLRDTLLGVNVIGLMGSHSDIWVYDNDIRGGGFDPIAEAIGMDVPDAGIGGITIVSYDADIMSSVWDNRVDANLLGISAVGIGSEATVRTWITDNHVSGGGSGLIAAHFGLMDIPEMGLGGINIIGIDEADMRDTYIGGNHVWDHLLGINMVAISDARLSQAVIEGNELRNNGLGITGLAVADGRLNGLEIRDNTIQGGGLSEVADLFGMDIPDRGIAGITLIGAAGGRINNLDIRHNEVTDHLLGITLVGIDGAEIQNGTIRENLVENNLLGITALGIGNGVDFSDLTIAQNEVSGNGLATIGELLDVELPDMGVAGITVVMANGAEASDLMIRRNDVHDNVLGIGVIGIDSVITDEIRGNNMENTLVGIGVIGGDDAAIDSVIVNNEIHNVIGPDYSPIDSIFQSLWGIGFPNPLPQGAPAGIVVAGSQAGLMRARVRENTMTGNTMGALFAGQDNSANLIIQAHDNVSDAPYYRTGNTISTSGSGNTPPGIITFP